jgi:hypothetical protein
MKHCVIPSEVSCNTHLGYLIAHQSSKSWTPDEDRMRAVCMERLVEAHSPPSYMPFGGLFAQRHCDRMVEGLFNGDLLVTFSN